MNMFVNDWKIGSEYDSLKTAVSQQHRYCFPFFFILLFTITFVHGSNGVCGLWQSARGQRRCVWGFPSCLWTMILPWMWTWQGPCYTCLWCGTWTSGWAHGTTQNVFCECASLSEKGKKKKQEGTEKWIETNKKINNNKKKEWTVNGKG